MLLLNSYLAGTSTGGGGGGGGGGGQPGQEFYPTFLAENYSSQSRTETILAPVFFREGDFTNTNSLVVSGVNNSSFNTSWRIFERWPDEVSSIKTAQAQFVDTIPAGQKYNYKINTGNALLGSFTPHAWSTSNGNDHLVGTELIDRQGVAYRCFASGAGEVVVNTPLQKITKHRYFHYPTITGTGIGGGRDFLASNYYITEFASTPIKIVDWIFANDYSGIDDPLWHQSPAGKPIGPVVFNSLKFLVSGTNLHVKPYRDVERVSLHRQNGGAADIRFTQNLAQISAGVSGYTVIDIALFNDVDGPYRYRDCQIGDMQSKRFRFFITPINPGASNQDITACKSLLDSMTASPIFALPTIDTCVATDAWGIVGGPCRPGPTPPSTNTSIQSLWNVFNGLPYPPQDAISNIGRPFIEDYKGFWGTRNDVKSTSVGGLVRNNLAMEETQAALQYGDYRGVIMLEQRAWVQAMRPYHVYNLSVADNLHTLLWTGYSRHVTQEPPGYGGNRTEQFGRRYLVESIEKQYRDINFQGSVPDYGATVTIVNDPYLIYRPHYAYVTDPNSAASVNSAYFLGYSELADCQKYGAFNTEHFTMQYCYDYYILTGDMWAFDEIKISAQVCKGMFKLPAKTTDWFFSDQSTIYGYPFGYLTAGLTTVRSEAWFMLIMVEAYLITGDEQYKNYALKRLDEVVKVKKEPGHLATIQNLDPRFYNQSLNPFLGVPHPSYPFNFQFAEGLTDEHFGANNRPYEFYMPWQHGGLIHSYLAAYKYFKDSYFFKYAEECALMVEASWMENYASPNNAVYGRYEVPQNTGVIPHALRYYVPAVGTYSNGFYGYVPPNHFDNLMVNGEGAWFGNFFPLGGSHSFLTAGLFKIYEQSSNPTIKEIALKRARMLKNSGDYYGDPGFYSRSDRWIIWVPERFFTV